MSFAAASLNGASKQKRLKFTLASKIDITDPRVRQTVNVSFLTVNTSK